MKKIFFLPILLIVISCTSLNTNISQTEIENVSKEVNMAINDLKEAASFNKYEKLEEFFLPTFKNKIIVNNIKQYDLSKLTFIFSDVLVISSEKAKSLMVINYDTESDYYDIVWTIDNGQWKISNVAVKK